MIVVYYTSIGCRRCSTLRNMLKSKNIKYGFERERKKLPNKMYPIVRTPSGKVWDYQQMHGIILNERWGDLE